MARPVRDDRPENLPTRRAKHSDNSVDLSGPPKPVNPY
jgi:hypothetical protein